MTKRTIKELFKSRPTIEGAGVHLHRVFSQPEIPKFDPFLLLDDFSSHNPDYYIKGFPWHPHRGIETVTYIKSGKVEHQDSLGNKGVIGAGDIQWMTAGGGIIHQEMPQDDGEPLQGMQLWVNLSKENKMTKPRYMGIEAKDIPKHERDGVIISVISGEYEGLKGPTKDLFVDVRYLDVHLAEKKSFTYELPSHYTAFIYVYKGEVMVGDESVVEERFAALTNEGDSVEVSAKTDSGFIFVAGEPIGEPVAWGEPIVMNTQEELQQAFWELQNDEFIK
jgi:redox-sensitive bicupin YhaK (pirin superfamily)